MIWRFASLIFISCLAFSSCISPPEITISTETTTYQGDIFIGGNVNNPGLYPFSSDDRLSDLINAAGGLKSGGDLSGVELLIAAPESSQKIDINRAEAWLLEALPGVGAATAQAIIAYREANGAFRNLEDLLKIPGIGPATLSKIAPYAAVGRN